MSYTKKKDVLALSKFVRKAKYYVTPQITAVNGHYCINILHVHSIIKIVKNYYTSLSVFLPIAV